METLNVTQSYNYLICEKLNLIQFFTLSCLTANVENVHHHFECKHEHVEPISTTHLETLI